MHLNERWELLNELNVMINHPNQSIKLSVGSIRKIRNKINDTLSDEENLELTSRIKTRVQQEANYAVDKNNGFGSIIGATGVGKSKIAIDRADTIVRDNTNANILIVVPTEKLKNSGWKDEFAKWNRKSTYGLHVRTECYASLSKIVNTTWDLVILDEGHNITINNSQFFDNNIVKSCILLTATNPTDKIKSTILKKLKLPIVYEITIDESVSLGLVAPYDVAVIRMQLDDTTKYLRAGNKDKIFYVTEREQYNYLSKIFREKGGKFSIMNRLRFIYSLRTKTAAAKNILTHLIPQDLRMLIFCGSKDQANEVCGYRYYSKPTKSKNPVKKLIYEQQILDYQGEKSFNAFIAKEINRLACVDALNEGHNINDVDIAFIIQLNKSWKDLIQRIGRIIRYKPGFKGKIFILVVTGTVDEEWTNEALKAINPNNITYYDLQKLRTREQVLNFDL